MQLQNIILNLRYKCMIHNYIIVILTKVTANAIVQEMDLAAPEPQDSSVLTMQQEHRSTPL